MIYTTTTGDDDFALRPAPEPAPAPAPVAQAKALPAWLTVDEVCAELGITRSTYNKWRARRVAPPAKKLPNGSVRTRRADLEAFMDALEQVA